MNIVISIKEKEMKVVYITERTLVREFEESDDKALIRISSKPFVTDWLPDWKGSEEWALLWITGKVRQGYKIDNPFKKGLSYAVIDKISDVLIGNIMCIPFGDGEVEIGYFIDEDFSNQGYITEAMRAFCDYLFDRYDIPYIVATILPDNLASVAVVKKLGFEYIDTVEKVPNQETDQKAFGYYRLLKK